MQALIIPQLVTIWLVPIGLLSAYFQIIPISFEDSLSGAFLGYGILWLIAWFFKAVTKQDGLGVGDMELLGMIGSFLGLKGAWFSLMLGSFSGLLVGGIYLLVTGKNKSTRIPFGPFLAGGALLYFFYSDALIKFFMM